MAIREALLAEYDHEIATTRRLLECVPGDRLGWKPHPQSRSIGALAAHLAEIPGWALFILDGTAFDLDLAPPGSTEPATRVDILERFDRETSRTRKALDRSDAELNAMWSLQRGGQEMFSMPRCAALRTLVLGHVVHHRGQLSVYLRLNDIPLPPIYGPTADTAKTSNSEVKSQNLGSQNLGSQNLGSQNLGSQNSGSQDSGSQDSGSQNLGA